MIETTSLLQNAEHIAQMAHKGQFRKDGITAYFTHVLRVAGRLYAKGYTETVIAAGWLHDVLEDTSYKYEDLAMAGLPEEVLDVVSILTRHSEETYEEFLFRISQNQMARDIKIQDIIDNLSDDPSPKQIIKYSRALLYLHGTK